MVVDYNNELRDLVERIEQLEFQLHSFSTTSDYNKVEDLHIKVKDLCQKLEVSIFLNLFTAQYSLSDLNYNLNLRTWNTSALSVFLKILESTQWKTRFQSRRIAIKKILTPLKALKKINSKSFTNNLKNIRNFIKLI